MSNDTAAFLRGVNVNGNKIKMDALKEAFENMGFAGARTVLNTGNVVFAARAVPVDGARPQPGAHVEPAPVLGDGRALQNLKPLIEGGLKSALGYDAPVYLRTAAELETLRGAAGALAVPEGCHLYLLLCDDAALPAELDALFSATPHGENEHFHPAAGDAFWVVPKGETLSSPFGAKVLGAKQYKARLTSRNWNTIKKIIGLMQNEAG